MRSRRWTPSSQLIGVPGELDALSALTTESAEFLSEQPGPGLSIVMRILDAVEARMVIARSAPFSSPSLPQVSSVRRSSPASTSFVRRALHVDTGCGPARPSALRKEAPLLPEEKPLSVLDSDRYDRASRPTDLLQHPLGHSPLLGADRCVSERSPSHDGRGFVEPGMGQRGALQGHGVLHEGIGRSQ
jgi:hypothetical protein